MRRFSVLVQRAERAIAQANQPVRSGPLWGFETPQAVREGLSYNELKGFRSAHNSLTDEEFEELVGVIAGEPMTRRQLQEIAQEKRALALEPENEEDGPGLGPDAVEEIVARIGGQVRDIVAQLPVRSESVLEIVGEDLRGLEKRLGAYPGNTARMQGKFERLRELQERGASRTPFGTFRSAAITPEMGAIAVIAPLRSSSNASGGSPRETDASPWLTPEPSSTDCRCCAAPLTAPAEPGDNDGCGPGTPCGQTADLSKRDNPEMQKGVRTGMGGRTGPWLVEVV